MTQVRIDRDDDQLDMIDERRHQLTFLLLRGFDLSDERWENGLVGWVDACADTLATGGSASYYRHELGFPS